MPTVFLQDWQVVRPLHRVWVVSDYYSLMTTSLPTDVANTPRGIGTYVLGQPTSGAGIRPRRYTPDMTVNEVTYDFIKTASIPHGVGFVWATMLWDLTWALRDRHGLTAGTDISINLVNQGLNFRFVMQVL